MYILEVEFFDDRSETENIVVIEASENKTVLESRKNFYQNEYHVISSLIKEIDNEFEEIIKFKKREG